MFSILRTNERLWKKENGNIMICQSEQCLTRDRCLSVNFVAWNYQKSQTQRNYGTEYVLINWHKVFLAILKVLCKISRENILENGLRMNK